MDRYARQRKLAEVGAAGQGRIGRLTVDVKLDGLAADVAARYLAGAGVRAIRVRDAAFAEAARALAPALHVEVDSSLAAE
ncbi:MAG: HesA/MoeB/ThiF family protein, partial [Myxococcota bacterium]|nr:HesA/MoeB/ThiF family protein [Myxococcota bacterium]